MGKLWDIVQAHIDQQPYGVSQRRLAKSLGISPTALGNWRDPKSLPDPDNLHALANLTGTPYLRVLDAALEDAGYIPRAGGRDDQHRPPMNQGPAGPAPTIADLDARRQRAEAAADELLARPAEKRAARKGTPDNPSDATTGEGSQDEGGFDPA